MTQTQNKWMKIIRENRILRQVQKAERMNLGQMNVVGGVRCLPAVKGHIVEGANQVAKVAVPGQRGKEGAVAVIRSGTNQ